MLIRKFNDGDWEDCKRIAVANWDNVLSGFYPKSVCERHKRGLTKKFSSGTDAWVLEDRKRIIGFATVRENKIKRFFIEISQQNKGFGSFLLTFLKINYGFMAVESANYPKAIGFYKKNGFNEIRKTRFGILMSLSLHESFL